MKKSLRLLCLLLCVAIFLPTYVFADGRCNITLKDVEIPNEDAFEIPDPINFDFESGDIPARLNPVDSTSAKVSIINESATDENQMLYIPNSTSATIDEEWTDFVFEADLIMTEYGWFRINYRIKDGNYYSAMICVNEAKAILSIRKIKDGKTTWLSEKGNYTFTLGDKVNIKLVVKKKEVDFYLNGAVFISAMDTDLESGTFKFTSENWSTASAKLDNIKIEPIPPVKMESASAIEKEITIGVGETAWLPLKIEPQGVYDVSSVIKCDDSTVVEANNGSVKGLRPGSANVRMITNDGNHKVDFKVNVVAAKFNDIKDNKYEKDIEYLAAREYISGSGDGKYNPYNNVTRAELYTMAVKAMGYDLLRARDKNSPKVAGLNGYEYPVNGVYDDVEVSDWFSRYIRTASVANLIADYIVDGNNINPGENITKKELAAISVRAYKNATGLDNDSGDVSLISDIAHLLDEEKKDIASSVKMGFIELENGMFKPDEIITRDYMAHVFANVFKKAEAKGILPVVALDVEVYAAREKTGIVVDFAKFGGKQFNPQTDKPEDRFDNHQMLVDALAYCKEVNADKLVFPKGYYYFATETIVRLDKFSDFIIDGQGSTFVNKAPVHFLRAEKCERCELRNINYEWDWDSKYLADIIKVTDRNDDEGYLEIEYLSRDYVPIEDVSLNDTTPLDPETLTPGYDNGINNVQYRVQYHIDPNKTVRVADNKFKVWMLTGKLDDQVQPGCFYKLEYFKYKGNFFVGYSIQDFTFDNVNVRSTSGIGYTIYTLHESVSEGMQTTYWQMINSTIDIAEGEELIRPVSTSQDGLQGNGQAKDSRYRIENCSFGHMGDDCNNIHQRISQGIEFVEDDRFSLIATKADWSTPLRGGDTMMILNDDFTPTGFEAKIISTEYLDNVGLKLKLDREVPQNLPESCIVSNRTVGQNTWGIIRNNYYHDNLGRNLLIRGDHILIENNKFERSMSSATMTEVEITVGWVSGLPSSNMIFRNNTFIDCNKSEAQEAVMNFTHNLAPGYMPKTALISKLLIEDNTFINPMGKGIRIDLFEDVTIRNNKFYGYKERPEKNEYRSSIYVTNGNNLKIYGNTFEKSEHITDDINKAIYISGVDSPLIYDNIIE